MDGRRRPPARACLLAAAQLVLCLSAALHAAASSSRVAEAVPADVTVEIPTKIAYNSSTIKTSITVTPFMSLSSVVETWELAPACDGAPTLYNSVPDIKDRRWGTQHGASCAFKDAEGRAVFDWSTAPRCSTAPNLFVATADSQGRLWGWQFGRSCVFKAVDGDRPLYDYLTAPRCTSMPEPATTELDLQNRPWGWERGAECAYKYEDNTPMEVSAQDVQNVKPLTSDDLIVRGAVPTSASIVWRAAPKCKALPSKATSIMDVRGRLWGFEDGASCAFKDDAGQTVYDWDTAPRCLGDVSDGTAHTDSAGRLWDFEAGNSCAYKDLAGNPLRTWMTAPRCPYDPTLTTSIPDHNGRLWGWIDNSSLPCAFRDAAGAAVPFIPLPATNGSVAAAAAAEAPPTAYSPSAASGSATPSPPPDPETVQVTDAKSLADGAEIAAAQQQQDVADQQSPWPAPSTSRPPSAEKPATSPPAPPPQQPAAPSSPPAPSEQPSEWHDGTLRVAPGDGGARRLLEPALPLSGRSRTRKLLSDLFAVFPSCQGDITNATYKDAFGRSWGYENGRSCIFRPAQAKTDPAWTNAPACLSDPTTSTITSTDNSGRYWGWEEHASCAFKDSQGNPRTKASSTPAAATTSAANKITTQSSTTDFATGDVKTAPSCSSAPTMDTSQPDGDGYLWGYENGQACVFRGSDGKPVYYAGLIVGDLSIRPGQKVNDKGTWFDMPRCSKPPTWSAQPDSQGRLWGYEDGTHCVYRDARGFPLFYSDLQNGNVEQYYNQGNTFDNAPRCPSNPTWSTARADNYGRLWGWDPAGWSCAFKDADGNAIYPPSV